MLVPLAISQTSANLSLYAQLGALIAAVIIGRFVLRSRGLIMLVSFLGCVGAMFAHIVVDGQGAFIYVLYTPIIYFAAVAGRRGMF